MVVRFMSDNERNSRNRAFSAPKNKGNRRQTKKSIIICEKKIRRIKRIIVSLHTN